MMDDDTFESPLVTENTSETGEGDSEYGGGGGGGEYGGFGLVPQPPEEFKSPMAPPKLLLTDMMKKPSKVVMLKVVINPIYCQVEWPYNDLRTSNSRPDIHGVKIGLKWWKTKGGVIIFKNVLILI